MALSTSPGATPLPAAPPLGPSPEPTQASPSATSTPLLATPTPTPVLATPTAAPSSPAPTPAPPEVTTEPEIPAVTPTPVTPGPEPAVTAPPGPTPTPTQTPPDSDAGPLPAPGPGSEPPVSEPTRETGGPLYWPDAAFPAFVREAEVLEVMEGLPATASLPTVDFLTLVKQLPFAGDEPVGPEPRLSGAPPVSVIEASSDGQPSSPYKPSVSSPARMPPADRIVIPRIGVDSKVVHLGVREERGSWVWETPDHAVGHHAGTANPMEGSNTVLSGHISSPVKGEGSVFSRLPEMEVGDWVHVQTGLGILPYMVEEIKLVGPADTWVMYPTGAETLTLITCYPDLVYTHRLVVTARPLPVAAF